MSDAFIETLLTALGVSGMLFWAVLAYMTLSWLIRGSLPACGW